MIKILHLADIHLGYSYRSKNFGLRSILDGAIENSFERAVEFSINNQIDILIIAGDLFDFGPIGPKTYDFFMNMVKKLKVEKIQVLYALGNHDNLSLIQDKIIESFKKEIIVFDRADVKKVSLESRDGDLYNVYGLGHEYEKMDENLIKTYPRADKSLSYNIGLAHCYVESALTSSDYDKYLPTTYADLLSKNYDYFALGHIHLPSIYKDSHIAYSGSLQGLSFKEDGSRGGNYVEIDGFGTSIRHVNFSSKVYRTMEIEMSSGDMDHLELINFIKSEIINSFEGYNFKNTLLRIILKGNVSNNLMLLLENEIEYISEQLTLSIACDYILINIDDLKLDYNRENVINQKHFLSYSLNKFDQEIDLIEEKLLTNMSRNGVDTSKIDINKCTGEIRELMLTSLLKR